MLEGRDVPAVLYWNPQPGTDLLASVATNWRVGSATGAFSNAAPSSADDLFFMPTPMPIAVGDGEEGGGTTSPVSQGCVFSSASGSLFASIHLVNAYGGTVTFQHDITVGGYEQTSGSINQTVPNQTSALTLTVTSLYSSLGSFGGAFTWTGGVLNSGTNAGVVKVVGMTNAEMGQKSQIDGSMLSAGSLTTGSTVSLLSGTVLATWGAIVLNNDANFIVGQLCVNKDPQVAPPVGGTWGTGIMKGNGSSPQGGIFVVQGECDTLDNTSTAPIYVAGGKLDVSKRDVKTTGTLATRPDGTAWIAGQNASVGIYLETGTINIANGRHLEAPETQYIYVGGGKLTTTVDTVNPVQQQDRVSWIDGVLWVAGGEVELGVNSTGNGHIYSTLHVSADTVFYGGVYRPSVNASAGGAQDRWTTGKKFAFAADATIAPVLLNGTVANENGKDKTWAVIVGVKGFIGATVPVVSVAADWGITVDPEDTNNADAQRALYVRKKTAT